MSSIKYDRALRDFTPATRQRIGRNIPGPLWRCLSSRQLRMIAELVNATYLDGYRAAGGDTYDPITHCEVHRQALIAQLGAD